MVIKNPEKGGIEMRVAEMKRGMPVAVFIVILLLSWSYSMAGGQSELHKRFENKESVEISTVSGDCVIRSHSSDEILVDIVYDEDLEGIVEFKFHERSSSLIMNEKWKHSGMGEITWTLTVPAETEIDFSTASGDLRVSDVSADIEATTASGDIEIEKANGEIEISVASGDLFISNANGEIELSAASGDIEVENSGGEIELSTASGDIEASGLDGEIDLSTASGEIEINDSHGIFDLSCASGDINAEGIKIEGMSEFSTASGDVEVVLAESCKYDLELSAASGDVVLDYNGNELKGYFEMEARKRKGRIDCPFEFDKEEEFERNGTTYMRKSFSRGGDSPEIHLSTASGSVKLKK
jgi:DUF4097 and DUF4098 domain-containing protein YvlB